MGGSVLPSKQFCLLVHYILDSLLKSSAEVRSCVNREGSPGLSVPTHSSPVPDKPCGFCGREAPQKKEEELTSEVRRRVNREGGPGLALIR